MAAKILQLQYALQRLADYRIIDNNIDVKDIQHVRRCLVRPMKHFLA